MGIVQIFKEDYTIPVHITEMLVHQWKNICDDNFQGDKLIKYVHCYS